MKKMVEADSKEAAFIFTLLQDNIQSEVLQIIEPYESAKILMPMDFSNKRKNSQSISKQLL